MYVAIQGSGLEGHVSVKIRRIRNFQYSLGAYWARNQMVAHPQG